MLSRLPEQYAHLDLEDPAQRNELSEALGEIVLACRACGLPALSALVVRLDGGDLGYPGPGYYGLAHPYAVDELEQLAAWGRELEAAKGTTYPERLDGDPPAEGLPAGEPPVQLDLGELDAAIADAPNWALLMETSYRLCREHPGHADRPASNAKLWLIGRGLATGVERQIDSAGGQGSTMQALCEHVHKNHVQIDKVVGPLMEIREPLDPDRLRRIVEGHGRFCRLIQPVLREGRSARSFAAKYLHCHASAVPIFDSVARHNLERIAIWRDGFAMPEGADEAYYWFAVRFLHLYRAAKVSRPNVTVRLLDLYLLSPRLGQGDDEEASQGRKERTLKVLERHGLVAEGTEIEVMPDAISGDAPKAGRKLFQAEIGDIDSRKSVIWPHDGNAYSLSELSCMLEEYGLRWVRPKTFQLWRTAGEEESLWDRAEKVR